MVCVSHKFRWLVVSTDCPVSQGQRELGLDIVEQSTLSLAWHASNFSLLLFFFPFLCLLTLLKQEAKRGEMGFYDECPVCYQRHDSNHS